MPINQPTNAMQSSTFIHRNKFMKPISTVLMMGLAGFLGLGAFSAFADLEVSATVQIHAKTDFYEPLAAHGAWVEVGHYGRCWHPSGVAAEWRPYGYGQWVWTDAGWYWQSEEAWGWACYHYGYWVFDSNYGWVWIPDVEWAPAWVDWRVGGGYVGWVARAPVGVVVAPGLFAFVEIGHFHEVVSPSRMRVNDRTILEKTTVISPVKRENRSFDGSQPRKVVINAGPGLDAVQKATGKKFSPAHIREVGYKTPPARGLKPAGQEPPTHPGEGSRKEDVAPLPERSREAPQDRGEGKAKGHEPKN
jgi:hypothetical protein